MIRYEFTTRSGRVVPVTSAQRLAAEAVVEHSRKTGRPFPPGLVRIANARPVVDA